MARVYIRIPTARVTWLVAHDPLCYCEWAQCCRSQVAVTSGVSCAPYLTRKSNVAFCCLPYERDTDPPGRRSPKTFHMYYIKCLFKTIRVHLYVNARSRALLLLRNFSCYDPVLVTPMRFSNRYDNGKYMKQLHIWKRSPHPWPLEKILYIPMNISVFFLLDGI